MFVIIFHVGTKEKAGMHRRNSLYVALSIKLFNEMLTKRSIVLTEVNNVDSFTHREENKKAGVGTNNMSYTNVAFDNNNKLDVLDKTEAEQDQGAFSITDNDKRWSIGTAGDYDDTEDLDNQKKNSQRKKWREVSFSVHKVNVLDWLKERQFYQVGPHY